MIKEVDLNLRVIIIYLLFLALIVRRWEGSQEDNGDKIRLYTFTDVQGKQLQVNRPDVRRVCHLRIE